MVFFCLFFVSIIGEQKAVVRSGSILDVSLKVDSLDGAQIGYGI